MTESQDQDVDASEVEDEGWKPEATSSIKRQKVTPLDQCIDGDLFLAISVRGVGVVEKDALSFVHFKDVMKPINLTESHKLVAGSEKQWRKPGLANQQFVPKPLLLKNVRI